MKPKALLIFLFLICNQLSNSQNETYVDSLLNRFKTTSDAIEKIKTAQHLFQELKHKDSETAFKYAKLGLELSKNNQYKKGEGIAYHHLGYYYRFLPHIDSSRFYFKKSVTTLKSADEKSDFCNAIDDYAVFECMQGNYKKAVAVAHEGFEAAMALKSAYHVLQSTTRKCTILMDNGDFEAATKENLLALRVLDTVQPEDKFGKAIAYGNKGRIAMLRGNYDDALAPLQTSLNLLKSLDDKQWLAVMYIEIGNVYWYKNNFDKALENYNLSLEISKIIKRNDFIAINLGNMADIYSQKGELKKALKYYEQSLPVTQKIGALIDVAISHNSIASLAYKTKDYKKAIKNHTKAIKLSDSIESLDVLRDGYYGRSQTYEKMNNHKAALKDIRDYVTLQDSIFSIESAKQIDELKTQYETEKKETQIALQKQEIKTLNQNVQISNLRKGLYAGGMFSFIAISGLLYFGFKQRIKQNAIEREKQEAILKQEIAFKKKELTSQTLHLVQKSTFLQELKENLERIKKSPELFKIEFKRLVMLLKKESAEDKDWEVFKSYFSEVHNNFDNKLKAISAELSEKEIRLASFLRMNLSTKEIASMLNVLPESVLKSKYRLKKKLQLDKETDLNTFLNTL